MEIIHFNEYGRPNIPQVIMDAQRKYWGVIQPYLESMTLTEVRAMLWFINMDLDVAQYIITKAMKRRCDEK